ncbi:hypothetical protein CIPAW_06G032500 [Carya illinoinensis]|uniref:Endonuclease/exonuclease/phosphatase domain-containing protein n=1 Tax=Carya illinoinensis TaxID=32201 RepID=A0A8T1Q799_CARIL|nr:hypothetical protein CIPAW_06G032500 [Carya illinoinensis]
MWKHDIQLELLNYSQRHINAFITNDMGDARWLLTCFYGHPEVSQRKVGFDLLNSFEPVELSWCVIGDFNEILTNDIKVGGKEMSEGQMNLFRNVLEKGSLFDLGWRGISLHGLIGMKILLLQKLGLTVYWQINIG